MSTPRPAVRPRPAAAATAAAAPGAVAPAPKVQHLPPVWQPTDTTPSLPIGVAVLAVVTAVLGVVLLLGGALFLLNAYFGAVVPVDLLIIKSVDPVGAAVLVLFGAVFLSVATALWRQEPWALWTTIVGVFLALTYLFFTGSITVLFLLFLLVFIYLLTVRHHFY